MTSALHATIWAASQEPQGPEFGKASPLGLLIIILLLIGTALLIWSMNRQLKKLPKTFDSDHPEADQAFDEGTDVDSLLLADPLTSEVPAKGSERDTAES